LAAASFGTLLADALVIVHLLWVVFMVGGVAATCAGLFYRRLLAYPVWRTIHLLGILYAGLLSVLGRPCPLTTFEYALRRRTGSIDSDTEGFIIRLANRLIFPDLDARVLAVVTLAAALVVIAIYIWRSPAKARRLLTAGKP
jgi:hypothetical protein